MRIITRLMLWVSVTCLFSLSRAQTWNGSVSSAWGTAVNWTPASVPGAGSTVTINAPGTNPLVLDASYTVTNLNISGTGSITLGGFQLTCSGTATLTGGSLSTGTLQAASFGAMTNTTFNNMTLVKSGNTNNDLVGGNTFNGTTVIRQSGGARLRMANATGDVFTGNVTFQNTVVQPFELAYNGRTTIAGNATLVCSSTSGLSLGGGTGTCAIQGTIEAGAYTSTAPLTLRGVKQVATTANGTFSVTTFTAVNDTLNGAFNVAGSTAISLTTSRFLNTCTFSTASFSALTGCTFSTVTGSVTLNKTGAGNNDVAGGNTFGPGSITNSGSGRLRMASTTGDTYTADFTFVNSSTNQVLDVSYNGTNTFAGNVAVQNSSSAGILFSSGPTGNSVITGSILNAAYNAGPFTLNRVKQLSTTANGSFSVTTFTALSDTLNGDISVTATTAHSLTNSFFERNCTFTGPTFSALSGCRFATTSGTALITRNGTSATGNSAGGGNTFGTATITQSCTGSAFRMANTTGDTHTGNVTFVNTTTNQAFEIAYNGTNTFQGNVTFDNVSTSGTAITMGGGTGRSVITGNILNAQFTGGSLTLRKVKQLATTANGTFSIANFTALNDTLYGDISITAATAHSLTTSFFERSCTFISPTFSALAGCRFATTSGTAIITRNGASATAMTAAGGNTFGTAIITQSGTGSGFRMASTTGDTHTGNVTFVNTTTNQVMEVAYNGTNLFLGNVSFDNVSTSATAMSMGGGTGYSRITGNLLNTQFTGGSLTLRKVKQEATTANGTFSIANFTALTDTLYGDINVTTTGTNSLTNSHFERNCTFTGAILAMGGCRLATTAGTATITRNGTSATASDLTGGNTFGPAIITQAGSGARLRLANTTGDVFTTNVTFVNSSAAQTLDIASNGINTFQGDVLFDNVSTSATAITMGAGTGYSRITGNIVNTQFTGGSLTLRKVRQVATTANGTFSIANFTALSDTLSGDISITTSANQSLTTSIFERNCTFIGAHIATLQGCQLATVTGSTAIVTKNGATASNVNGGNTFGNAVITNSGTNRLQMSTTTGDTYLGNVSFINTNAAQTLIVSNAGITTIAGDVSLQNTSTGGITIGPVGPATGTTVINGTIQNLGFAAGPLSLRRLRQASTSANGTFSVTTFIANTDTVNGAISVTASVASTLVSSRFESSVTMIAASFGGITSCRMATTSGTAVITKTGATDNDITGGNTFGPVTITHSGNGARLRFANTVGDTYLGNVTLNNQTTANSLAICYAGTNTIAGNLNMACTSSLGVYLGSGGGNTVLSGVMQDAGFTSGLLSLIRVKQLSTSANGPFNSLGSFLATNDTLNGPITVTASTDIALTTSRILNSCTFSSPAYSTCSGNLFATTTGTARFTRTGASATASALTGGNTFGEAIITQSCNGSAFRTAGTTGDVFTANVTLVNTTTNQLLDLGYSGTTTVAGNIMVNNVSTGNPAIRTGGNGGTTVLAGNLRNTAFTGGVFSINRLTQQSTTANDAFSPTSLVVNLSTLSGDLSATCTADITVTTSTFERSASLTGANITLTNSNRFSIVSGSSSLRKTAGADNTWTGGCRFGNVTITNNSGFFIRMANTNPDTFMTGTTATFIRTGAGVIQPAYTANAVVLGNISTVGSTGNITFGANTGRVMIQGNAAQTFSGGSAVTTFARMTINTTGTFSLNSNLNISTNTTFTAGNIQTSPTGLLIFNAGSAATGASNASYVDGPVRKIGNTLFTFPTGDGGIYGPTGISAVGAATDHYTAEYFLRDPNPTYNPFALNFPLDHITRQEYWEVQRTGGTSQPELTFYWNTHSGGVPDPGSLTIARWTGSAWTSEGIMNQTGTPAVGSASTGGGINTFGIFTFASLSTENLPVVLTAWSADEMAGKVFLAWQTSMEQNSSHFEIERSGDNRSFVAIGQVQSQGNSTVLTDYDWIDASPLPAVSYYRLRMVDINGDMELSEVLSVSRSQTGEVSISYYPNPVKERLFVNTSAPIPAGTKIALIDAAGHQLETIVLDAETYSFDLDVRHLIPGAYFLRFDTEFWIAPVQFITED